VAGGCPAGSSTAQGSYGGALDCAAPAGAAAAEEAVVEEEVATDEAATPLSPQTSEAATLATSGKLSAGNVGAWACGEHTMET